MNKSEIIELQKHVGTKPDGIWGSASIKACQDHLRKLMPKPSQWPSSDQASLRSYYGRPGNETSLVGLDVRDLDVRYEGNKVATIRCHERVAASLKRALVEISKTHPEILRDYAGCYNNRSVRGGDTASLHAYGAAIDFCPGDNGNHQHWPTSSSMPIKVMEAFAREGWLPAGAFWSRDAMHFQATR